MFFCSIWIRYQDAHRRGCAPNWCAPKGTGVAERTVVEAVNDALTLEMARDDRVLVFGEDVGVTGGVFRATEGLFTKYGKERVIDTPLSEGVIAGAAIGLAIAGWVPVAEI